MKETYEEWMKQVDRHVYSLAGVSVHDLGDFMSRDMYQDGCDPEEAAQEALERDDFFSMIIASEGWSAFQ